MTITKNNILTIWMVALAMGAVLSACHRDSELKPKEEKKHAIAFTSDMAEQEAVSRAGDGMATRAGDGMATRADMTLGHDFVVYGYKNVNGTEQTVFNGYTVKYSEGSDNTSEDNTHGYHYVEGPQLIKYWDFAATEYHFWGMWANPSNRATFSGEKNTVLTINNVRLRVGDYPTPPVDDVLFSELNVRYPVSEDVVQMRFMRPYAKLRIQFYTAEPITDPKESIELSSITFSPDPAATSPLVNAIYEVGDVSVTYPLTTDNCTGNSKETIELTGYRTPRPSLVFDAVTLLPELGVSSNTAVTAPIDESEGLVLDDMGGEQLKAPRTKAGNGIQTRAGEVVGKNYYYYPLPMDELNPAFIMKVSINGDTQLRSAVVPAIYMQWKANFFYTYIFKISEAGRKIEFYDVKIEPWRYSGSQEDEWKNW